MSEEINKYPRNSIHAIRHGLIFFLLLGLTGCSSQQVEIKLSNPADIPREDAQIVISRDSLLERNPNFAEGVLEIVDSNREKVPYQLDDLDGDGEWEELALVHTLPAGGAATLFARPTAADTTPSFIDRAQVWFARRDSATGAYERLTSEVRPDWYERVYETPFYYQFEGPGWENDHIGFRLYFDERNGIDIWGKKTEEMVLQNVGKGDDYHSMADWGMDILKVGNSLGAGAIGAKTGDTLHRLQGTEYEKFEQVASGPVRAIFDLVYKGWDIDGKQYDLRQRISIWAGAHGYRNKVTLTGSQDSLNLVAGMVIGELEGNPEFGSQSGFEYILGPNVRSANDATLGMSLLAPGERVTGSGTRGATGGSVENTAFLEFNLTKEHPASYRFLAGWETGDEKFGQREAFKEVVLSTGRRMEQPVEVSFSQ